MNRDEIKFNQTHWNNRKKPRPVKNQHLEKDYLLKNDYANQSMKDQDHNHGDTIFTSLNKGESQSRPVISPPPEIAGENRIENEIEAGGGHWNKKHPESKMKKVDNMDEKRKRMASFRKEFSSMLEESAMESEDGESGRYKGDHLKIDNPILPQILSMLEESSSEEEFMGESPFDFFENESDGKEEEHPYDKEEYSILKDIVSSIGESASSFKEHYESQSDMSRTIQDKDSPPMVEEVYAMLEESSSLFKDEDWEETYSTERSESSSLTIKDQEDCEESLFPSKDELEDLMECSSSYDVESSSSSEFEINDYESSSESSSHVEETSGHPSCIIKAPILLSSVVIDVDVMEALYSISSPFQVIDIKWSLSSLESTCLLPSSTVFTQGVLAVDIHYVCDGDVQSIKVPVKWEKVVHVRWNVKPEVPCSTQREYALDVHQQEVGSIHYECEHKYANPVEHQVRQIHFITDHDVVGGETIAVQGNVRIGIDLFQDQYVSIHKK
ncbi:hypothetical protein [Halobacillus litoralis]|uniref:hypothetical protein n=1 Tax=Halobacillus litoralis TaxID=45668 RepID=UPI001CFCF281|nr:hypothetical protein [Halobacillus litoralis]